MEKRKRLRVSEVNPHLICVLCGGYYIDATTIIECLHTFCKTCIVGYLEASKHCPVCDNLVHKTKPHLRLRPDHTLQDFVYKVVPGLFQGRVCESGILGERERTIYSADEQISVILELSSDGAPPTTRTSQSASSTTLTSQAPFTARTSQSTPPTTLTSKAPFTARLGKSKHATLEAADRRYLLCPGSFTIGNLKKFVRMKFNLCDKYQMDFYHADAETLHDHYSLLDVAYIYSWRRKGPLRLYYTVYTNPVKRFKADVEQIIPMATDEINTSDKKQPETSGYLIDEETLAIEPDKPGDYKECNDSKNDSGLGMEVDYERDQEVNTTNKDDGNNDLANKKLDSDIGKLINGDKETNKIEHKSLINNVNIERKKHTDENEYLENKDAKSVDLKITNVKILKENSEESLKDSIHTMRISEKEQCTENYVGSSNASSEQTDGQLVKTKTLVTKEFQFDNANDKNITSEFSTTLSQSKDKCISKSLKVSKACVTDDDNGEPVVSSTQNTQGSQTEQPDSVMEVLKRHISSDITTSCALSPMYKSTVDVSCETDDSMLSRQLSKDCVSVSTETEIDSNSHRKNYVHCSNDMYDLKMDNKKSIECNTDLNVFSTADHKRSELSVDCSVNDIPSSSLKRKSIDSDSFDCKVLKTTDSKVPKRSLSYCDNLSIKAAYHAQPLSPTKLTLKFTATKFSNKTTSKSSAANAQSLNLPSPKSLAHTSTPSVNQSGIQLNCQSSLNSPALRSPGPTSTAQKSPSSAEPSGFQSQYQSFVMELPEKASRFEYKPREIIKPITVPKSVLPDQMVLAQTLSRKTSMKSGRPRGRPPKNCPLDATSSSLKVKKSKSKSRSPLYETHIEKSSGITKEMMINIDGIRRKITKTKISNLPKISNAYSWIKKIDSNSKTSQGKPQKFKLKDGLEKPPSDKIIPKQFVYFSNGQYTIASVSCLNTLKQSSPVSQSPKTVFTSEVYRSDKHIKNTNNEVQYIRETTSSNAKHMNTDGMALKGSAANEMQTGQNNFCAENTQDEKSDSAINPNLGSNLNRIVKQTASKVSSSSTNVAESNDKQMVELSQYPEYCHQIPFYASLCGTGLSAPHRPATHLNIPNPNSYFSGTRHLYSQERFGNEGNGTPLYRSFSCNDSSTSSTGASKYEDTRRIEETTLPCSTYLPTYSRSYLGVMHGHLLSSLPPPPPLTRKGLYSNCEKSVMMSDSSSNAHNVQSSTKATSFKSNTALPKGKEKSLDRVISAITEMRTKKETQEQLNGIDLSTNGTRQNEENMVSPNLKSGDKFEFTDDEDISPPQRLHAKPD